MKRQVQVSWNNNFAGSGLDELVLHIPVLSGSRAGLEAGLVWTEDEKRRIAQIVIDTALQPLEAIEQDGLK